MRRFIAACVILMAAAVVALQTDFFREAHRHYADYWAFQKDAPRPYSIEVKSAAYFAPFIAREGWHSNRVSNAIDQMFDQLHWAKKVKSVENLYSTDTTGIGVLEWMLRPRSTILPRFQAMRLVKQSGGVISVDAGRTVAVEVHNGSMVTLFTEGTSGIEETLLVDDALFAKIQSKKAASAEKQWKPPLPTSGPRPAAADL